MQQIFLSSFFSTEANTVSVTIKVPVGELMKGTDLTEHEFTSQQSKLTGMTESSLIAVNCYC